MAIIKGTRRDDLIDFGWSGKRPTFANDTITGKEGNDKIYGYGGHDVIDGGVGNDTLIGGSGHDLLNGGEGNDNLRGGAGNDTLEGGAGKDRLLGGEGDDVYVVTDANDIIIEKLNQGSDTIETKVNNFILGDHLENLVFKGLGNFSGKGNELNNRLTGGVGPDQLSGLAGNDTLIGGGADDILNGGTGDDSMVGGAGNDNYIVDSTGDIVTEASGGGTDTVVTSLTSYTLGNHVENLIYNGTGNFTGTGNNVANVLKGGGGADTLNGLEGNDTLDGGAGADELSGGLGDDTYVVDHAGDVTVEAEDEGLDTVQAKLASYTLGANLENLTYIGTGAFAGTGNAANNLLVGGAGNDTLDGGAGVDSMSGGAGNDVYVVDDLNDVTTEANNAGIDTVQTNLGSYTLGDHIEILTFTGEGDFSGTGNNANNVINGGDGSDMIDGLLGADTMAGGMGNDFYTVDDAGDLVSEGADGGLDTVLTSLNAYTLTDNVETLVYLGSASFQGMGNAENNLLVGGSQTDTLFGGDGNDRLDGNGGNSFLSGGAGQDTFVFDAEDGTGVIGDYVAGSDILAFDAATLQIGDLDVTIDGIATLNSTADTWNSTDELVFVNVEASGNDAASAAALMNSFVQGDNFPGDVQLLVINSGTNTYVYRYEADSDVNLNVSELTMVVRLTQQANLTAADFEFL